MSKLYFKFGAMASSKTANALMTRFNYEEKGNHVWLIKPDLDNRDDYTNENGVRVTVVKSRIGLSAVADVVRRDEDIHARFVALNEKQPIDVIICDECQFLTAAQVDQMKYIAEYCDTPVLCFGLRTDFQTHLFPGSLRLMELADAIEEIKTMWYEKPMALADVKCYNPSFDVTDHELITAIITEKGICRAPYTESLAALFDNKE